MNTFKSQFQRRTWTKDQYLISTDSSLIPIETLMEAFASDDFYWAKPLPASAMKEMLDNSLCFGLYELQESISCDSAGLFSPKRKLVGISRLVTDFITFAYLTDVWVDREYQGRGLGRWLVNSVQEVIEMMPHLRRSMLFTADWRRSVPFYEELMDMKVIGSREGEGLAIMERKGKGHPSYGSEGAGYN
ncbi:hypothetical protein jhhlp_004267 [Lomentospora prolificans]|uniref:N-acetyltransferase domain-containing protein n=1 Tax=Lomentospora prolificans TaxID=41688 RepID=A0A2N3NB37_9PEZI|nr:hypothetical protein jhhlp_004267 [Lomentospora prolificans]